MRQNDTYNPTISEGAAKALLTKNFVAWTNPVEKNVVYIRDYKIVNGKAVSLKNAG